MILRTIIGLKIIKYSFLTGILAGICLNHCNKKQKTQKKLPFQKRISIILVMKNSFDEKILDEAHQWIQQKRNVVLATVIQTWGSSPRPIGSRMIINDKGDFSGSVSGGCVEGDVVRQSIELLSKPENFKKIEYKVSNESAWEVGLACGGEIAIFLEKIH